MIKQYCFNFFRFLLPVIFIAPVIEVVSADTEYRQQYIHRDSRRSGQAYQQSDNAKDALRARSNQLDSQIAEARKEMVSLQKKRAECAGLRAQQKKQIEQEIQDVDQQIADEKRELDAAYRANQQAMRHGGRADYTTPNRINASIRDLQRRRSELQSQLTKVSFDQSCENEANRAIGQVQARINELEREKANVFAQMMRTPAAPATVRVEPSSPPASLVREAPWGFGPRAGGSAMAGLPPQPKPAVFETDEQRRAREAAGISLGKGGGPGSGSGNSGAQKYVTDYLSSRAASGNPVPANFFDVDPAIVKYDSEGNGIDAWGFVVEYQSEADRQAAIIEARTTRPDRRLPGVDYVGLADMDSASRPDWLGKDSLPAAYSDALKMAADIQKNIQKNQESRMRELNESLRAIGELARKVYAREGIKVDPVQADFYRRWQADVEEIKKRRGLKDGP